ncbi:MAG TPA: hypothetical protein VGK12_01120 [Actinomycetota bacterium]|jgi:hypothetical protein
MKLSKLFNGLRSWLGMLTFLSLLVAGLAYGASWVARMGLEKDAVAETGRLAGSVIEPALTREDVQSPITGARYDELRTLIQDRVLRPSITSLEIWNPDGTIVFADRSSLVGERVPEMRDRIHNVLGGDSRTIVEGDTLRALVGIGLSGGPSAVVEIDRSYAALVAQAREPWDPWVARGLRGAAVLFALYLVAVGVSIVLRRRRASVLEERPKPARPPVAAPPPKAEAKAGARRRKHDDRPAEPAYTQPGFREQLEAQRAAEDALVSTKQELDASEVERQRLQQRLARAELELRQARSPQSESGATTGR